MIEQGGIVAGNLIVSIVLPVASILISIASVVISIYVAKKYGDVAGTAKMIQYEQKRAVQARISTLQSLINEVERIRKVVERNSQSKPVLRVPTAAFDAAFISGQSGLVPGQELLSAVTDYLTYADTVNTWIGVYLAAMLSAQGVAQTQVMDASLEIKRLCTDGIPPILDRLGEALQCELDKETRFLLR
jgi:hypothetical protein